MDWSSISTAISDVWNWYVNNRENLTPIGALLGGTIIAWAALRQAAIASRRHYAQTESDRQRRITESYSKAVEQLSSDKIEQRLGGIYTLERISRESPNDYWTIMETLTAFVHERAHWKEPSIGASETMARFYESDQPTELPKAPPTDIAAVLTVIKRRRDADRAREEKERLRLDLNGCDFRAASLSEAHLARADLALAHLEGANLAGAHLEGAVLEGADLTGSKGLTQAQLDRACGTDVKLDPPLTIKPCP